MKRSGTLFAWPSQHNIHIALPLLLVVSFLIHAACVLLFQVVYPKPLATSTRSAQVFFLKPGSREAARVQPMLGASDPALFSPAQAFERDRRELPESTYIASFDAQRPSLAPLPAGKTAPMAPNPIYFEQKVATPAGLPIKPGLPTSVSFGGELAGRSFTPPGRSQLSLPELQNLASAEFLVAVSPEGLPVHIIPQDLAGAEAVDPAARAYALTYLTRTRFTPGPDTVWGSATFQWGSDVQNRPHP